MDPRLLLIAAAGVGIWFTGGQVVKVAKKARHAIVCSVFKHPCEITPVKSK